MGLIHEMARYTGLGIITEYVPGGAIISGMGSSLQERLRYTKPILITKPTTKAEALIKKCRIPANHNSVSSLPLPIRCLDEASCSIRWSKELSKEKYPFTIASVGRTW